MLDAVDAAPLVDAPPATVGELAAGLGLRVAELEPRGVAYAYAWDVHHELPPASVGELARRALTAYRVPLSDADACEAVLRIRYGNPAEVEGRRRYGRFLIGGRALEWHAELPGPEAGEPSLG